MRREGIEVGIEVAHIYLHVCHCLCSVYEHGDAVTMGYGYHLLHGIDGAEHIAHMGYAHQAGVIAYHTLKGCHIHLAGVVDRHHIEANALASLKQLPWHYIGMVLHGCHYYLVAVAQTLAVAACHQIDGLGGAARKHYLLYRFGADILAHFLTRGFHHIGGFLREGMHSAMHIGFAVIIHLLYALHHTAWHLRGCGIVEID